MVSIIVTKIFKSTPTQKGCFLVVLFGMFSLFQAQANVKTGPAVVVSESKYNSLKAEFEFATLPTSSALKQWWIGRCYSKSKPNEPDASVAVPVSNRNQTPDGPLFPVCEESFPTTTGLAIITSPSMFAIDHLEESPDLQREIKSIVENKYRMTSNCNNSRTLISHVSTYGRSFNTYYFRQNGSLLFAVVGMGEIKDKYCYYYRKTSLN